MGGAFSASSLCRFIGGVEIVTSSVIVGFGIQSLVYFHQMGNEFQENFQRIQYSSIAAIVHGLLTILASVFLIVGSNLNTPLPKGEDIVNSRRQGKGASVLKTWLIFSILSIGLLLFVFISPIEYCVRDPLEDGRAGQGEESREEAPPTGPLGKEAPCSTSSPGVERLRGALKDLYSYSLVNILALLFFVFLVYSQLKNNLRNKRRSDKEACIPPEEPQPPVPQQ